MADWSNTYDFSPEFLSAFQTAVSRSEQQFSEDETESYDSPKEEGDEESPYTTDEWQTQLDDLNTQNQQLKDQLESASYYNQTTQVDDLLKLTDNNLDTPNSILQMAMEQWSSDLPVKSDRVRLANVDTTLTGYVNSLRHKFGDKILVTSGNDQYDEHATNSLHKQGEALDLRYYPEVQNYIANDPVAQQLGFRVLPPDHGTAPHTHIEKRQYGGLPQYPDGGKVKGRVPSQEDIKPTYQSTLLPNQSYTAPAAPPNQLPTVTVVGPADKETADSYDAIKDNDFMTYQALTEMGLKYGFSKIRNGDNLLNRPNYNPFSNTVNTNIPDKELNTKDKTLGSYMLRDRILAELPHKLQYDKSPSALLAGSYMNLFKSQFRGYNANYADPTSTEYEAHSQIEPRLREEFSHLRDAVRDTDPYVQGLVNMDNEWHPDIEALRKQGTAYEALRASFGDANKVSSYTYKYGGKYKVK